MEASRAPALAVVALLLVTSGCVATRLSSLQHEFEAYRANETTPTQKIERWDQLTDTQAQGYLEIAEAALEGAGRAEKRSTRVGFYRLAAVSGWLAGDLGDDVYGSAQSAGAAECETRWEGEFKPPRDCTLLIVLPAIVASTKLSPRIAALEGASGPDAVVEASKLVDDYPENTWKFVFERRARLAGVTGHGPSVLLFVDREERTYYCNFAKLERLVAGFDGEADLKLEALKQKQSMFSQMSDEGREPDCRR